MTVETAKTERPPDASAVLAIGFVLLSGLLYVFGYSLSKALVNTHGLTALQVTFLRCALVLAVSLAAMPWPDSGVTWARLWRPQRAWEQRAAAAALVGSNVLAVLAYSMMPVTAASALGFTAPLLLTALGGLVLRERISLGRGLGAALGFAGMLLIVRPDASAASLGIAASLGAATAYAVYQLLVRRLRAVASSVDTAMQVALVGVILLSGTMIWFWRTIGWEAFGVVVLFTLVQTTALASIAAALRRSEASRLAPWQFFGLLWAMLMDAVMFATWPSIGSLLGGALIIAGGLLAQGGFIRMRLPR
ncbi:DMT family transporter [Phreatobacter stygius]|uniref:DMT family transporter n=1 Tax=Phreatobacter stygius TaxID=1940610 RepID=UPI00147764F4|nr:DMT family transporter [Phreatobacter stygius]